MTAGLSQKDEKFLKESLHAPMLRVVLTVGMPLALYQTLQQLFSILDTMMASHISAESVSAVAYLSQLSSILSAIGSGLAIGAGILISRAFGEENFELVKRRVSTLYAMCLMAGLGILLLILPVSGAFLRFAGTPEELIRTGQPYFRVQLLVLVVSFLDNVYISVERARGNAKRILRLNLLCITVKLILTALFVYVLRGDLVMIAYASFASQSLMLFFAVKNSIDSSNIFGFHLASVSFRRELTAPMLHTSYPVMLEKALFSFGKTIINSMAAGYGALTVGALGVSNNLGGITTNPQNGFQDGAAAIISQNEGAQKPERVLQAFHVTLLLCMLEGALVSGAELCLLRPLSGLFSSDHPAFQQLIMDVYRWEALGAVPLGANCAVMALLYGLGETRFTLLINVSRVFVFRIPVFLFLRHCTNFGSQSCGVVMFVSNFLTAVLAMLIGLRVIHRYRKIHHLK